MGCWAVSYCCVAIGRGRRLLERLLLEIAGEAWELGLGEAEQWGLELQELVEEETLVVGLAPMMRADFVVL